MSSFGNNLNTSTVSLTKESLYAIPTDQFAVAGKKICEFLKKNGERGFESIAREGTCLLLLKNDEQTESVKRLLEGAGLTVRTDKLLKLSLSVDLQEVKTTGEKTETADTLTNFSVFE